MNCAAATPPERACQINEIAFLVSSLGQVRGAGHDSTVGPVKPSTVRPAQHRLPAPLVQVPTVAHPDMREP
jgi:hypothetical protein